MIIIINNKQDKHILLRMRNVITFADAIMYGYNVYFLYARFQSAHFSRMMQNVIYSLGYIFIIAFEHTYMLWCSFVYMYDVYVPIYHISETNIRKKIPI